MKALAVGAGSSRGVQLAALALVVAVAATVWLTRPTEPVFALGEMEFEDLALAMEADMASKHGCAGTETSISTHDASGHLLPDFTEDDPLPAELVELFERRRHSMEHVDEWRIQGARVVILAHDLDDDVGGARLFSTLTELMQLTGGSVGEPSWAITQSASITECW